MFLYSLEWFGQKKAPPKYIEGAFFAIPFH
nr:MAG TPA: hypothetical protein [Caudoviricetes sp.]